jgi:uncharacterized HAD superfamily protein
MRFAFDVDGVITEMPELFSALTVALKAAGHYVYILTDFDEHFREQRLKELAKYNIAFDEMIITSQKEQFVRDHAIDYAFDDDREYYGNSLPLQFYAFAKP